MVVFSRGKLAAAGHNPNRLSKARVLFRYTARRMPHTTSSQMTNPIVTARRREEAEVEGGGGGSRGDGGGSRGDGGGGE